MRSVAARSSLIAGVAFFAVFGLANAETIYDSTVGDPSLELLTWGVSDGGAATHSWAQSFETTENFSQVVFSVLVAHHPTSVPPDEVFLNCTGTFRVIRMKTYWRRARKRTTPAI